MTRDYDPEFIRRTLRQHLRREWKAIETEQGRERQLVGKMREACRTYLHHGRRRYAALRRLLDANDRIEAGLPVIDAAVRHVETCPCADELDAAVTQWKESAR